MCKTCHTENQNQCGTCNSGYYLPTEDMKKFDNDLEDSFEIYFNEIKKCDNYLDVWNSLNVSDKYIFSKKEKNYLSNIK